MLRAAILAALLASNAAAIFGADGYFTTVKPYAVSVSPDYVVQPILSVGNAVPRTSNAAQQFQMVGIPDGLGMHRLNGNRFALLHNSELNNTVQSQPIVGGPLYRGAIVSKWILNRDGAVISGDLAYNTIHDHEKNLVLDPATTTNTTPGFARFCSASLSWQEAGFDRPIYFTGEESGGAATFDGKGALGVAIFDQQLHTLPWLGRFPWENTLARPDKGRETVLLMMEDGPTSPDSQLYMWVGTKSNDRNATALQRNGIARDSGKLFVLVPDNAAQAGEHVVINGSFQGHWVELTGAEAMTDVQLEAASDAVGAFGFIRTEDGAFDKKNPNVYYFVTTGGSTGNQLGRLYRLDLNSQNPAGPCKLTIIYNADAIIAAGGDTAVSPDNIDTSRDYLLICEDGTAQSRPVMTSRARDGSIWKFDLKNNYAAERIVELNPPGTDAKPVTAGIWETSGVIDSSDAFGPDSWVFDVQAHAPTTAPAAGTVEDGQILILRRANLRGNDHDDKQNNGKD